MGATLLRAGKTTHLKILAVALSASIAIVIVGINARSDHLRRFVRRLTALLSKQARVSTRARKLLPFAEGTGSDRGRELA